MSFCFIIKKYPGITSLSYDFSYIQFFKLTLGHKVFKRLTFSSNHWTCTWRLNTFYGSSHILRDLDFCLRRGETLGLMGRNGMGKSTLLKTLMGIVPMRRGALTIKGQNMLGRPIYEVAQMGIAYVPEGRGIFGNLSVAENLQMAARPGTQGQCDWTYERVLDTFPRLKERRDQLAGTMSGGEQQMLAMGRALMSQPKLLLLDEPSMGLSPLMVDKIFEVIQEVSAQGVTILLVEQNARQTLAIAHHGYVLSQGRVVAEGQAQELANNDDVRSAYFG